LTSSDGDGEPIRFQPRLVSNQPGKEAPNATGNIPDDGMVRIVTSSSQVAARQGQQPPRATFTRQELDTILNVYGRMVAAGEWKDYAIDFGKDRATFSVFRRTSEMPIYRIEKQPKLARRQGAYSVISQTGLILKRGPDLERVLSALDKRLRLVEN